MENIMFKFQEQPMTTEEMDEIAIWLLIISGCSIVATLIAFVITH